MKVILLWQNLFLKRSAEIISPQLGQGEVLSERMVIFDALDMKFRNVKLRGRNKDCISCGESPLIKNVAEFDYNDFC